MIHKGFLRNRKRRGTTETRNVLIASKMLLIFGILISLFALSYMLINFDKADSIINIWLPFMIAGVALVFLSIFIKLIDAKRHR
jgi:hypothetical protein